MDGFDEFVGRKEIFVIGGFVWEIDERKKGVWYGWVNGGRGGRENRGVEGGMEGLGLVGEERMEGVEEEFVGMIGEGVV